MLLISRSVSTSDILRLQEIEAKRRQIYGLRAQSVSTMYSCTQCTYKKDIKVRF